MELSGVLGSYWKLTGVIGSYLTKESICAR